MAQRKGRKSKGYLYKRGTHGYWYLQYDVNGKRLRVALKCENGLPITVESKAKIARDKLLSPVTARNDVQRREMAVKALETAKEMADQLTADLNRIPFKDSWQRYSGDPTRPQSGEQLLQDYARRWRRFCEWIKKDSPNVMFVDDITEDNVKQFARRLDADNISNNRFNKIMQGCRLVFKILIPKVPNPFAIIENRDLNTKSHRELSVAEIRDVCGKADGELRVLLAIGIYTALRLKDACLLSWESINMDASMVTVIPSKTKRKGKVLKIPLHPVLKNILAETPIEERKNFVVPELASRYQRNNSTITRKIRRHFEKCGITTQERHADQKNATCLVGFHSLRHSFVSIAADKGVPLSVVQELAGHGSPAIQKHYIHVGRDAAKNAISSLPSLEESPNAARERRVRDELKAMADSMPIDVARKALATEKREMLSKRKGTQE